MSQGSNIRMENLFSGLKEVQNEKVCLEQKLHELKVKRHMLEQELDQAKDKCIHFREKHGRMSETLAVAQQKVDMSLASSVSLQTAVERNQPKLEQLQQTIETEKRLQLQHVKDFESALMAIAYELFEARDFYKKPALDSEICICEETSSKLENEAEKSSRDVQNLTRCLEKLTVDEKSYCFSNFGVETALSTCYSVMERDEKEAETYLNRVRDELKEIHDILHSTQ